MFKINSITISNHFIDFMLHMTHSVIPQLLSEAAVSCETDNQWGG